MNTCGFDNGSFGDIGVWTTLKRGTYVLSVIV
jgi:hypothetical protein